MAHPLYEHAAQELLENMLGVRLQDAHRGQPTLIVAPGFRLQPWALPESANIIVLNEAASFHPDADYWLTAETDAWRFPWFEKGAGVFKGQQIHDHGMLMEAPAQQQFHPETLWHCRDVWDYKHDWQRNPVHCTASALWQGLYYSSSGSGEIFPGGTVTMQAIHLAAIMGSREIHVIGAPLCWRRGGPQHMSGWNPYTPDRAATDGELTVRRFNPLRDWTTIEWSHTGDYETTDAFWQAAVIIRGFIERLALAGVHVGFVDEGLVWAAIPPPPGF